MCGELILNQKVLNESLFFYQNKTLHSSMEVQSLSYEAVTSAVRAKEELATTDAVTFQHTTFCILE